MAEFNKSKIFITSYPYVYERYFRVWDYFSEKEKLVFILPENWTAKGGQLKILPPQRDDIKIITTKAYFSHSHYPLIRGLLKGWMPKTKSLISGLAKSGDILYTAIEPNLLTTYFNSCLAKKLGLKHAFFTWQNVPYNKRLKGLKLKFTEKIIKATIANSTGAICGNSKAVEILKSYAGENFKILTAPISGVDTEKFQPNLESDFRQKYNLESKIILTFAGVFDERKGIKTLLETFLDLSSNKSLHLIMIGIGPLKSYVKNFIAQNRLEETTTLIDWLSSEKLAEVFSTSDIFVYPSEPFGGWQEQFGYSMAEASACNLPVVSTRTGSIGEVVVDGKSGILVEPGNKRQLAEALLELIAKPDTRKQMGQFGRQYVADKFSHPIVAEKFYNFFRTL